MVPLLCIWQSLQCFTSILTLLSHNNPLEVSPTIIAMWVHRQDVIGPKAKNKINKKEHKHVRGRTYTCNVSLNPCHDLTRELSPQRRQLRLQGLQILSHREPSSFITISLPAELMKASKEKSKDLNEWRITDRKARGLQTEEISCKCQTFFLSLLNGRRKQTNIIFSPFFIQI